MAKSKDTKTLNLRFKLDCFSIILEVAEMWAKINNYKYDSEASLIADYLLRMESIEHVQEPYFDED